MSNTGILVADACHLFHFGKLLYLVGHQLHGRVFLVHQVIHPVRIAVKPVIRRFILYPHACQCEAGKADGQTHDADHGLQAVFDELLPGKAQIVSNHDLSFLNGRKDTIKK